MCTSKREVEVNLRIQAAMENKKGCTMDMAREEGGAIEEVNFLLGVSHFQQISQCGLQCGSI